MASDARFLSQVRDALQSLHDRPRLQVHPLLAHLPSGTGGRALQVALEEAVGALRPPPGTPPTARAARIHRLLHLRYVEGLEPGAIWPALGVGRSEYFREHARGVAAVASVLRERLCVPRGEESASTPEHATAPASLPAHLSSFVGREEAVAAVRCLLGGARLVTLTGPPGAGKTRLAVEVASALATPGHGGPGPVVDGVRFVPLAAVATPDLVLPEVGEVLGVPGRGERPLLELLAEHLKDKPTLVVLDNFEQVLDAAPAVAELLRAAPGLRALVTSRAPLRVGGEHEYPVGGLDAAAAARLFVERARAADPGFAPAGAERAALAAVCQRLDGLPLAIELAAARSKVLTPSAMLARLERRLDLLTGGARDLPARHRTLRAAIAWSYDLLQEDERRLFRRLAVFAGGFTLEAAQAVGGAPALDGVGALVDGSLLQRTEGTGERRFVMLETIREYALERLAADPAEAAAARDAHAACVLALLERAAPELGGPAGADWSARLAAEEANFRAAVGWRIERHDPEAAVRLMRAHATDWRGNGASWRGWLAALRALPAGAWTDGGRSAGRALLLGWSASSALLAGAADAEATWGLIEEGLALARELGDEPVLADLLGLAGKTAAMRGLPVAARPLWEERLAIQRRLGAEGGAAESLHYLGAIAFERGDLEGARAAFGEEVAASRARGHLGGLATGCQWLGNVALEEGDVAAAAGCYDEALAAFHRMRSELGVTLVLLGLGVVALELGDHRRARDLLAESLATQRALGVSEGVTIALEGLAGALAATAPGPASAERALRLAGAAAAARERPGGWRVWPNSAPARDRLRRWLAPARRALGAATAEAAWAAGCATALEAAIAEALAPDD